MTRFEQPIRLVRELKGAPLSIYVILLLQGTATLPELAACTGYSENVVRGALTYMSKIQVAQRHGRYGGWTLMSGVMQLPLMAPELESGTSESEVRTAENESRTSEIEVLDSLENETSESEVRTAENESRTSEIEVLDSLENETSESEVRTAESESRTSENEVPAPLVVSSSSLTRSNKDQLPPTRLEPAEIAAILDQAGIRNPKRAEILAMEGISALWVRGHIETSKNTGQAIYRILRRWSLPAGYHPGSTKAAAQGPPEPDPVDDETQELWDQVKEILEGQLERTVMRTWLPGARLQKCSEGYRVVCSNPSTREILEAAAAEPLRAALQALTGQAHQVKFVE